MAIKPKRIKLSLRDKRKKRIRKKISGTDARPRLCVFRSSKQTYAQLISDVSGKTLASASSREADVIARIKDIDSKLLHNDTRSGKGVAAARAVGMVLAERAKEHNISEVVFDRNGFLYHGRLSAVADGARASGMKL